MVAAYKVKKTEESWSCNFVYSFNARRTVVRLQLVYKWE